VTLYSGSSIPRRDCTWFASTWR